MRTLTCLLLIFAGVAVLCASSHTANSNPPVVAAPAVTAPAYGSAVPYFLGNSGGMSQADAKRMIELLESIDANQKRTNELLEAKGGPLAQKAKVDPLPIAKAKCATCHTPGKAEAKGGGFILFADDQATALKPLNAREKVRVKESVQSGSMPPQAKLSSAEKSAFDW